MNHHADKLTYTSDLAPGGTGEIIEEFHQCPVCGAVVSRPADAGSLA
jgi:hypothetical protein